VNKIIDGVEYTMEFMPPAAGQAGAIIGGVQMHGQAWGWPPSNQVSDNRVWLTHEELVKVHSGITPEEKAAIYQTAKADKNRRKDGDNWK
jgi:hypothetical protein